MGVHRHLLLVLGDDTSLRDSHSLLDGQDAARELSDSLKGLSGRVTSLRLVLVAREEDELALVLLQPLDVEGEGLLGLVAATVINADTDVLGDMGEDTSTLGEEFRQKEEGMEAIF